jgi:tetratricopeptide (TPR) repeat protein
MCVHYSLRSLTGVYVYIQAIRWESDLTIYEERSVAATFSRQFEQLKRESPDVSNLLKVFSFLDPENIPLEMMIKGAGEWLRSKDDQFQLKSNTRDESFTEGRAVDPTVSFPEFHSLATLITSPIKFQTALQKLQGLSLVECRSADGHSSVWIHDLIKLIMQDSAQQEETYRDWLCSSISFVYCTSRLIDDLHSPQSWEEFERFIPHIQSLDQIWGGEIVFNLELSRANLRIAEYMQARGRYQEAEALLLRVLTDYEEYLGVDDPDTLVLVGGLGAVYSSQGRYGEAEGLYRRALAGRQKFLGADHMDTVRLINGLANVHVNQGRLDDAERLHQQALAWRQKYLGAYHRDTLTSLDSLGLVYKSQGRYDDAEASHRRALAGREEHLGITHRDTLGSMNNLALVYWVQQRYEEATTLHQLILERKEKLLGVDHPDTLVSVYNLASIFGSQGQYDQAEVLYQRALTGRERLLGADHTATLNSVEGLALVYYSQGRYDEAEAFCQRALVGREKRLVAGHPEALRSMKTLVNVYTAQGRHAEATALYRRILERRGGA